MALTYRKRPPKSTPADLDSTPPRGVATPEMDSVAVDGRGANGEVQPRRPESALPLEDVDRREGAGSALTLAEEFGGGRLLLSDLRLTFHLVNYLRVRALAQVFGVGPDQANLLTFVIALALAQAAEVRIRRLLEALVLPPGDSLLAGTSAREALYAVGGPASRDIPLFATLLATAVVCSSAGPTVIKSLRILHAAGHRTSLSFHHRYGYIVDPGHWRQRLAERSQTR